MQVRRPWARAQSEEAIAHLFEPFFTTRAQVTAWAGLALSAGIVRESGGTLGGANHPGGGAVFPSPCLRHRPGSHNHHD